MTPWSITIALTDGATEVPMFQRIARGIITDITRGRLRPGSRLPGTRTLARELRVNRQTVVAAYDALAAEGWLTVTPASGAYVSSSLPDLPAHRAARVPSLGSVLTVRPPPVDTPVAGPTGMDLSSGQPDLTSIPVDELSRAFRRALRLNAQHLLGYGDAAGHPRLRAALAQMVSATRALPAAANHVVVTAGSQMAWTVLGRTLAEPGDRIAVEAVGYRPAWAALRQSGAELVPIPVDAAGLDIDAIRAEVASRPLAAVYVTPHRQYPTTVTMSADRRIRLLELAAEHRFAIIEDDYDHEFHYGARPVPPIASMDAHGCVIYVGTLSKVFAPGLRLGFVVAPPTIASAIARHRAVIDMHGDHVVEAAVAELLEDGLIQRHINRLRRVYSKRREVMLADLTAQLGEVVRPVPADGGLGIWCTVDDQTDVEAWAARCAQHGLGLRTGRHYTFSGQPMSAIRLSFAPLNDEQIHDGIRRLAAALS